jgi:curli biogenesis system outer membrane secretion channel CsgG
MTHSMIALAAAVGCLTGQEAKQPLLSVQRIYVDRLSGEASAQIRDMIINALQSTKLFVVTENQDRADATLRGSAEDLIYNETFQASEGVSARAAVGSGGTSSSRRPGMSASVGENESIRTTERKHEASAAVRLVNRDGDVVWSTTQESAGAKFRGAGADVADKVVKQLLADIERARRGSSTATTQ